MIFKKNFEIGLQDININRKIKNRYILSCLENIAAKHSDSINLGLNDLKNTGITWMLLDWKVEILKRPSYGDILEVSTWSRHANKCYAYRDFEIYVNGEKCIIATSKWVLFDINRKRPIRVEEEVISKYKPEIQKTAFDIIELEKMQEMEQYDKEFEYIIRKSDIDFNGHLHNLNYLDIVYEIFDENIYNDEPNNIRICYKKEIKLGDKVICKYIKNNNKYHFIIGNEKSNNAYIELY